VGLKAARDAAADIRDKVRKGVDPLAERAAQREAAEADRIRKQSETVAERATLLRVVRDYHEAHVEPKRSTKHAAQWIASVEAHIPAKTLGKPIADVEASELLDALTPLYLKVPEEALHGPRPDVGPAAAADRSACVHGAGGRTGERRQRE
jgi:hypothetical protein